MNISYFSPELPEEKNSKKVDKSLLSPGQVIESAQQKAQNMHFTKNLGLISKNENRLLTDDGREIFNENK